jgi:hypothetical protein
MHDGGPTYDTLMVTELLDKTGCRRLDMEVQCTGRLDLRTLTRAISASGSI